MNEFPLVVHLQVMKTRDIKAGRSGFLLGASSQQSTCAICTIMQGQRRIQGSGIEVTSTFPSHKVRRAKKRSSKRSYIVHSRILFEHGTHAPPPIKNQRFCANFSTGPGLKTEVRLPVFPRGNGGLAGSWILRCCE